MLCIRYNIESEIYEYCWESDRLESTYLQPITYICIEKYYLLQGYLFDQWT